MFSVCVQPLYKSLISKTKKDTPRRAMYPFKVNIFKTTV